MDADTNICANTLLLISIVINWELRDAGELVPLWLWGFDIQKLQFIGVGLNSCKLSCAKQTEKSLIYICLGSPESSIWGRTSISPVSRGGSREFHLFCGMCAPSRCYYVSENLEEE